MLGRVVELQPSRQFTGLLCWKGFIQRRHFMGIQIVQHHPDHRRVRIKFSDMLHAVREFDFGPPRGDVHLPKTAFRFADHHQIADAFPFIAGVIAGRLTGLRRERLADFRNELLRTFVETHNRAQRIVGFFIKVQHVFHRRDKFSTHLGNAPLLLLPGFESVFLKADGWFHSCNGRHTLIPPLCPPTTARSSDHALSAPHYKPRR